MAKGKDESRRIKLFIDGEEVTQSVNSVRAEIRRLTKEMNQASLGSKEYTDNMRNR